MGIEILLCDDYHVELVQIAHRIRQHSGKEAAGYNKYVVHTFSKGETLLGYMQKHDSQYVLMLDTDTPDDLDAATFGLKLARLVLRTPEYRSRLLHPKAIIGMSGNDIDPMRPKKWLRSGACHYIPKTTDLDLMGEMIKEAIGIVFHYEG